MVDDGGPESVAVDFAVPVAQMAFAIGLGREGVLAVPALVGPFAVVRPHVSNQGAFVVARARAHIASVRSVSQMLPVVTCQTIISQ